MLNIPQSVIQLAQQTQNKIFPKFKFLAANTITNNLKSVSWAIHGFIESHTLSAIFGQPASGKSFIVIDIACCTATGIDWCGHKVEQGAVFYIAGEGHNGLGRRIKAWEKYNNNDVTDNLYLSQQPAQFYNHDSAIAVADAIQNLTDTNGVVPKLIIIDTLARNFGGDENSTKDMNQFIQHIDELKDRWGISIIIVHHTGHMDKTRGRGSTVLKGALDHEYKIEKACDSSVTMSNSKMKDAESPQPKNFTFKTIEFKAADGTDMSSAVLVEDTTWVSSKTKPKIAGQSGAALKTLQKLTEHKGKTISINGIDMLSIGVDEYKQEFRDAKIAKTNNSDSIQKAFKRCLDELKEEKFIDYNKENIWLIKQNTETIND